MPKRPIGDVDDLGRTRKWQLLREPKRDGADQAAGENVRAENAECTLQSDQDENHSSEQGVSLEEHHNLETRNEGDVMQHEEDDDGDVISDNSSHNSDIDDHDGVNDSEETDSDDENIDGDNENSDGDNENSDSDNAEQSDNEGDQNDNENIGNIDIREQWYVRNGDEPVYEGAPITLAESMLAILTVSFVHNFTGSALSAILELIFMHCKQPSRFKNTLFKFRNLFKSLKSPVIRHYYCNQCWSELETENSACECVNRKDPDFFLEIPVIEQLTSLFAREGFSEDLMFRFQRKKKEEFNIEDLFDGELYQKLSKPGGFLSNENNFSFSWYSDGIPVFKSKKYSVWPIYLLFNELPYQKRISHENIIVAGLWFGQSDPQVNLYFKPLHTTFDRLYRGIQVHAFGEVAPITIRGMLLSGMADTPARCDFMCHVRFNGEYGCLKCFSKGYTIKGENFGNTHIYPFEGEIKPRTRKTVERDAMQALDARKPVLGVKGPSILSKIMPDAVRGNSIDVMHCVFLGVVKKLLLLWFDSKLRNEPFSLYRHLNIIDSRLASIKPPTFIQRLPRSIGQHLNYWKASEFKNFFFYYSLPLLKDLMPKVYFNHYQKLVCAVSILCSESIPKKNIKIAEELMVAFVSQFQALYDPRFMSINVHLLLHLPTVVVDLGPLWVTSCFPLEDLNGKLIKMVHGTRHVGLQLYSSVAHGVILPYLVSTLPESPVKKFSARLLSKQRRQNLTEISANFSVVGKIFPCNLIPNDLQEAIDVAGLTLRNVHLFYRLRNRRHVFYSSDYTRLKTKFSHCALFDDEEGKCVGLIKVFLCLCDCEETQCVAECSKSFFAFVRKAYCIPCFATGTKLTIEEEENSLPIEFIYQIRRTNEFTLVPVENLKFLCFFIEVDSEWFVAEPVNTVEDE